MPDIIGWSFLLISGNLINDYVDMDRKLPVGRKGLLALSSVFFIFGMFILRQTILYAIAFVLIGFLYNLKLKGIPYLDVLVLSAIFFLPYFSIAKNTDWNLLLFSYVVGVISLFIDKLSDEKKYKSIRKQVNLLMVPLNLFMIIFTTYIIWMNSFYMFLFPFIFVFVGILFITLKGYLLKMAPSVKIIGVYDSCALLFYFISILIQMGKVI